MATASKGAALYTVVSKHDKPHTTFQQSQGNTIPRQTIMPPADIPVSTVRAGFSITKHQSN